MGILMESTEVNLVTANYRRNRADSELYSTMSTPREAFYSDTIHTIAINTRETEFGSIVEPIPIMFKTYQQLHPNSHTINGYEYKTQVIAPFSSSVRIPEVEIPSASATPIQVKDEIKDALKVARPPKKKWIKEYLEEEPKSPVSLRVTGVSVTRSNGVVRPTTPVSEAPPAPSPSAPLEPAPVPVALSSVPHDFIQEHSRPRNTNGHGPPQIPSPPSVSSNSSNSSVSTSSNSNSSVPRAGTREVHNKLEKNRRAHLKECFELLKRQLPATPDDKKTSNLSILGSAIRYIQVLRRKERECEHEMERLAREKIAAQQRLAALKRDVSLRATVRPRTVDTTVDEKDREENANGQVLGIPISISSSPSRVESPPRSLNLSTKLRSLPIQITPTTSQMVRTSYGSLHNTLTLTTLASADPTQAGQDSGVTNTSLVHPAQIHLPLSQSVQVVGGGGLVVGPALQLLSGGLRVLHAPHNGVNADSSKVSKENGIVTPPPTSTESVMVSGLAPLVVSPPHTHTHTHTHLLHTHTLTHKMVETQMVKGSVPLTVSAQYLSTTIVKPVVVVSSHEPRRT